MAQFPPRRIHHCHRDDSVSFGSSGFPDLEVLPNEAGIATTVGRTGTTGSLGTKASSNGCDTLVRILGLVSREAGVMTAIRRHHLTSFPFLQRYLLNKHGTVYMGESTLKQE